MRVTVQAIRTARLAGIVCCGLAVGLAAQSQTIKQMHESLALVAEIESSIVRGDYQGAADPARALSLQTNPRDLPAKGEPFMDQVRTLAGRTSAASDIATAAASVAGLVSSCGECHVAVGAAVKIAAPQKPAVEGVHSAMLHHDWAVSLMTAGLQGPSDASWKQGAEELSKAQVAPKGAAQDVKDAEAALRALASRAAQAGDAKARAAVYGDIVASCGACHGLLGRVLGPGAPGPPK
jgi:cytochrome c553